jgi:hypothetical protein
MLFAVGGRCGGRGGTWLAVGLDRSVWGHAPGRVCCVGGSLAAGQLAVHGQQCPSPVTSGDLWVDGGGGGVGGSLAAGREWSPTCDKRGPVGGWGGMWDAWPRVCGSRAVPCQGRGLCCIPPDRALTHTFATSAPHHCRVMCVSFHLKQEWGGQPFFPGTGALEEAGEYQARCCGLSQAQQPASSLLARTCSAPDLACLGCGVRKCLVMGLQLPNSLLPSCRERGTA